MLEALPYSSKLYNSTMLVLSLTDAGPARDAERLGK